MPVSSADQRILRGTAATLNWQYVDSDGTAADPGTVTIGVTQADGTQVVAAGTATSGTGAAARTYALPATATQTLGLLTVSWTTTTSTFTTTAEIVGGYYFSVAEARASDSVLVDTSKYSDAHILTARREVEDEFERICGVAFVPRYQRFTIDGGRYAASADLLLPDTAIRTVRSVRVYSSATSFTTFSADQLADLVDYESGVVSRRWLGGWTPGTGNLVVEYEHGYDRPPAEVKRVGLMRLRQRLNLAMSGIPDRATSFTAAEGGTFRLDTPGIYKTGNPEIDAVLARYTVRAPALA